MGKDKGMLEQKETSWQSQGTLEWNTRLGRLELSGQHVLPGERELPMHSGPSSNVQLRYLKGLPMLSSLSLERDLMLFDTALNRRDANCSTGVSFTSITCDRTGN